MKTPIIPTTIKLTCFDCGKDFRWFENSTVKPKRCKMCQDLIDFQKKKESSDRIKANKIILAGATLYAKKERTQVKAVVNTGKQKKSLKEPKKRLRQNNWKDKDLPELIKHVQYILCNPYIRKRDSILFGKCISCNCKITQAGHRYCVGDFPGMRFLINNIHGQEISCNHFKSGNIDAYDRGLILRHGKEYLEQLKNDSDLYLKNGVHWSRFDVIEIGETYKYLTKNKIWIFTQKEFNHYRTIANSKNQSVC